MQSRRCPPARFDSKATHLGEKTRAAKSCHVPLPLYPDAVLGGSPQQKKIHIQSHSTILYYIILYSSIFHYDALNVEHSQFTMFIPLVNVPQVADPLMQF